MLFLRTTLFALVLSLGLASCAPYDTEDSPKRTDDGDEVRDASRGASSKRDSGARDASPSRDGGRDGGLSSPSEDEEDAGEPGDPEDEADAAEAPDDGDDGGSEAEPETDAGSADGGASGGTTSRTKLPSADPEQMGPFAVTVDERAGANSWAFRPTELGQGGLKHPIFIWGTGATSVPSAYRAYLSRIASHGIVVVSPNSPSVNASLMKASLAWILGENTRSGSPYFEKLDTSKIAMGGHSLGSLATFDVEATETRLTTTIHLAGGSFDGKGSSKVKTPTAYICGADGDVAQPQCAADFSRATKPTFYSELRGVGHVDAMRAGIGGILAWLRWHLGDEADRKADFTGPSGKWFQGIWQSKNKNWEQLP